MPHSVTRTTAWQSHTPGSRFAAIQVRPGALLQMQLHQLKSALPAPPCVASSTIPNWLQAKHSKFVHTISANLHTLTVRISPDTALTTSTESLLFTGVVTIVILQQKNICKSNWLRNHNTQPQQQQYLCKTTYWFFTDWRKSRHALKTQVFFPNSGLRGTLRFQNKSTS